MKLIIAEGNNERKNNDRILTAARKRETMQND